DLWRKVQEPQQHEAAGLPEMHTKYKVVAGWNYIIKYDIEETNCSKDQFQDLTPECKITSRGVTKCEAKAFQNLQPLSILNLLFLRSETCCSLSVEETVVAAICPGCPRTIPNDSPELKELLKVSMEKYNSESNDDFYYKDFINYLIKFWCLNVLFLFCSQESLSCDAQIHVIPWQNKIYPEVKCTEEQQTVRFCQFLPTQPHYELVLNASHFDNLTMEYKHFYYQIFLRTAETPV
uniref:Kininogen 1 n=1 Tax=Cyanoderma ruficeps TaxID=181631 RepID=A0A8C3P5Q0_9PASS